MKEAGLDAYIVPRADAHQGEYVAPCDERLSWLTGFTGSAGFCAVTSNAAAMFTDGRYTVQVRAQCDADLFEYVDWPETSLGDWLLSCDANIIGFDPWLHTEQEIEALRKTLQPSGKKLQAVANQVDKIWPDRPPRPNAPAIVQPIELTGKSSSEKFALVLDTMAKTGAQTVVFTLPDSLSWLLNIRGADIAHNPVVQAFATLNAEGKMHLFAQPSKFDNLGPDPRISIAERADFNAHLSSLKGRVLIDPASAPYALRSLIETAGAEIVTGEDPCIMPKACKTPEEIAGARSAHIRDGAAVVEFLAWLSAQDPETQSEMSAAQKLEACRAATGALKDISFDTISGSGPNGAIVHYRVSTDTDRSLSENELLLIDSGGQYEDGTTDITRTLALGIPTSQERAAFTAVLQGMIAISAARFPKGVSGAHLDALARAPLWRMGCDYDHGTGHGVGSYLSVHEGPQRISRASTLPLQAGMILSNEPGYYKAGAFGIRIENLIVVRDAAPLEGGDPREMLDFETLTFVPIERDLINTDELAPWERDWLDDYHAQVWDLISPHVSETAQSWLRKATQPL